MAKNTPFLPGLELRLSYSVIQEMCREFGIQTVDELPELINSGKLKQADYEKIIYFGLKQKHHELSLEKLRSEDGLFDKFMDSEGDKGLGDIVSIAVESLFNSGVLTRANTGNQVVDKGEDPQQSTNG